MDEDLDFERTKSDERLAEIMSLDDYLELDENLDENFEDDNNSEECIVKVEEIELDENIMSEIKETNIENSNKYRSNVWQYVNKDDPNNRYCLICNFTFSPKTSSSSIRDHLHRHNLLLDGKKTQNKSHPKKEQAERLILLVQWIIQNMQPFSIVENISFRNLLNKLDPLFVILKHQTIHNKILEMFIKQ